MATKEYALNTRLGAIIVELTEAEHRALTGKGGVSESSEAVLANAALILSYLKGGEASPGTMAATAGSNGKADGSWKRALGALSTAGLIKRSGYGPATRYRRIELPAQTSTPQTGELVPWEFKLGHTLLVGAPGTGKSNTLHALIHQEAPFVKEGIIKLYGIDPKDSEFRAYAEPESKLFARITSGYGADDLRAHADLLQEIVAEMNLGLIAGLQTGGRSQEPTPERPVRIVLIEDLELLLAGFERAGIHGTLGRSAIEQILATGRSLGVFLIMAAQSLEVGDLMRIGGQVQNRILFHQTSKFLNDALLGEGAAEAGADSTAIEAPTSANGYKTAGTAYAADGITAQRIRFPLIEDKDIAALIRRFGGGDDD